MKHHCLRALLATALLLAAAAAPSQTADWEKRISCAITRTTNTSINSRPHEINVLTVDGKRFEHVRGLKKCYLAVPELQAIVFVVNEPDFSVTYHVYKMETAEDIAIHAKRTTFGETIGFPSQRDTVEKIDGERIVLSNVDKHAKSLQPQLAALQSVKSLYTLDLVKKAVVAQKTIYYDKAGNVMEIHESSPPF